MEREENKYQVKSVSFALTLNVVDDVTKLEKIGAGHDGVVYRLDDKALKILKYSILTRKEKDLMTFEKAQQFVYIADSFKRIVFPEDILLDEDGIFCGYEMPFINENNREDFPVGSYSNYLFLKSAMELESDFARLSSEKIEAKDVNAGSFLFDDNFLHLCDTDKYIIHKSNASVKNINQRMFNYVLAKIFYWEMVKKGVEKEDKKVLTRWVAQKVSDVNFLRNLEKDMNSCLTEPIEEYATHLSRKLIKK